MSSLLAASEWISYQQEALRQTLDIPWKRMPCTNTYRYALAHLCSEHVQSLLADWLRRRSSHVRWKKKTRERELGSREAHQHIAVDGKVLKGTGKQIYAGPNLQQHVLHVYEVNTGIVLHQCPIPASQNEVSVLKPLLTKVLCRGRILTADAAQRYHEFGRLVQRAGGEVILMIKDNTPVARED